MLLSLESEKRSVERGLGATMIAGNLWEPISMEWYIRWKLYAEAGDDRTDSDLYPGPIDNSGLKGKFEDELRPGLIEGESFVLLPSSTANGLFNKYTGGPRFARKVYNAGSALVPRWQVALYRVRVEAYLCDKENPNPEATDPDRHIVRFFTKKTPYNEVVEALIKELGLSTYTSAVRCWLRRHDDSETETEEASADPHSPKGSPTAEITGDLKRARIGRILTAELTDRDGQWIYQRHSSEQSIQEVLGNGESVHIIIEAGPSRRPDENEWPRAPLLNKWKEELRVGDVVDACDKDQGKWYAAVVKEVSPSGDVSVHFKGWAAVFDEKIAAHLVHKNIQPLYEKTFDRRDWAVDEFVDFRCTAPDSPKAIWLKVKIVAVDVANDRVQVVYSQKEKNAALKKFQEGAASKRFPGLKPLAPLTTLLDDDSVKRQQSATASTPSSTSSTPSGSSKDEPDETLAWCDLLGEDICPVHTHTKQLKTTSFPGAANYLGSALSSAASPISNMLLSRPTHSPISSASRYDYSEKHIKGTTEVAGAVGLQNLGNTCFMNSILQCVSNTESFTSLFLSDEYKAQINSDNPLGHGGKLAVAYAKLIKDMWSHAYSKVIPRDFKVTIGEFQPQFAGYDQQDSQEFLGFLLDGLHEDLNRVVKKPHVSKIESKGRDDVTIASESWRRYLLRNDSALVDRCFGQLKSHVTCTHCGNESVTFDEYSSLSLPLPVRNTKTVSIVAQLLPLGTPPLRFELEVEVTATMSQLQKILVAKLLEHGQLHTASALRRQNSTVSMTASDAVLVETASVVELETAHSTADSTDYTETAHSPVSSSMEVDAETEVAETDVVSDAGTTQPTTSASSPQALDHYEVISHADLPLHATEDSFVNVHSSAYGAEDHDAEKMDAASTSESPVPVTDTDFSSSRASPDLLNLATNGTTTRHQPSAEEFHFHFGTLFSSRPASVFKSYNAAEAGGSAITSFVGRNDSLMAFQLEHRAPEFRSSSGMHVSAYSRAPGVKYDSADAALGHVAVDVCMGNKVAASGYLSERIELAGYPMRLSLPVDCTNRFVHAQLLEVTRRYLRDDTSSDSDVDAVSPDNMPYTLIVTNTYGSISKRTVPLDDEVFVAPVGGTDMLVVAWPNKFADVMDEDQLTVVRSLESDKPTTPKKSGLSVYQCFDKFIEREQLAEAETLYCSKCQQHLAPIKKMDLWAAPDILMLQLKRFQYVPGQYFVHREKINDLVDFPIEGLDLSRYVIGPQRDDAPPVYDLYAVSHHSGGLGGGHYTATCKNFINNRWYDFNDSNVSSTTPERAVTGTAYVLFYKRRTGTAKWAGIEPSAVPMPDE